MGESGREALEGIHVLVIDFDQHVLDLARAALEPAGALVMTTSAAGVDDVTLIADVILCDLELIEAVGEPFLTALRRKHRAVVSYERCGILSPPAFLDPSVPKMMEGLVADNRVQIAPGRRAGEINLAPLTPDSEIGLVH